MQRPQYAVCIKCGDTKCNSPLTSRCKKCVNERAAVYRATNRQRIRDRQNKKRAELAEKGLAPGGVTLEQAKESRLLKSYQMTLVDYNRMLEEQNGVCALCFKPPAEGKYLHVDHDHECCSSTPTCGQCTRGLLHLRCNVMEGQLTEEVMHLILAYRARVRST